MIPTFVSRHAPLGLGVFAAACICGGTVLSAQGAEHQRCPARVTSSVGATGQAGSRVGSTGPESVPASGRIHEPKEGR